MIKNVSSMLMAIVSSNINEVIRSILNFLFFFTIRFHKYKKAQNIIKTI